MNLILRSLLIFLFLVGSFANSQVTKETIDCKWDSFDKPCITITKSPPNTSKISENGVRRYIITSREIQQSNAVDINDVIRMVPGINITQSGPTGQQTSVFTRGTNSNHTLVLLNGIPINDQSTTQGLHDFGVDFIQSIQQVEVYVGANGAHFGPNAIGGAINFITGNDFKNKIKISGVNNKNKTISTNYNLLTNNGWAINFRSGIVNSYTDSARQEGLEKDNLKNLSANLNAEKWVSDNIKFKATTYGRHTVAEYDNSPTVEEEYTGDNLMYATQLSLDRYKKNLEDKLIFHYHKYDREYREAGILDEYESNSFTLRGERKIHHTKRLSFGFGAEHKYDWGVFENRGSYTASTKGNVYDSGIFTNIGFKPFEDTILSIYSRLDRHKTTGKNYTNKINLSQSFKKFKIGLTHSTGLRNPSLYELYGTDSYGYSGNLNLSPEKAKTKEIFGEYNFSENFFVSLTGFKSNIYDQVEYKNNRYINNLTQTDLNQSGIETSFTFLGKDQKFKFFGTSLSSKKTTGEDQARRPDKTLGINYMKKLNSDFFGPFQFNAQYKHYGKHWDTHSSNWSTILMDSTDILDLSLSKKFLGNDWSLNIKNLLNETYQRPHGYKQEGRQVRFGFNKIY
tara:strand:+ start:6752 stop:8626 length:1875 start_codon:yes stop_codon:yes gene_type:complete